MSKLLDLDELNQVAEPYARSKNLDTYNYILEQCHKKIKEFNKVHRSKFCYYKPPVHLMNRPMYNYFDLVDFLLEQLRRNGLHCQYVKSEGIFICWDPQVLNRYNYQSELENRQEDNPFNLEPVDQTPTLHKSAPRPKPKPKAKSQPAVAKAKPVKNVPKVVDILKIEGDEFPINIDGFKF